MGSQLFFHVLDRGDLSVCLYKHVHDLLKSPFAALGLLRDLRVPEFVQSGFSSSESSLPLGAVRISLRLGEGG